MNAELLLYTCINTIIYKNFFFYISGSILLLLYYFQR